MIDTHWLQSPKLIEVSYNDTTAALFDLYDIKRMLSDKVKNKPLCADNYDYTIGNSIDSLIEFLEDLDKKCTETTHDQV